MRILFVAFALLISAGVSANNYYFSSKTGNDSRSLSEAQNEQTPWKSLEKLNSIFPNLRAGDAVLFKRGDVFYGSISIQKSGNSSLPISFGAYGTGARPVITGFTSLSNWSTTNQKVWEVTDPSFGSSVNMVVIDGVVKRIGRYPNYNDPLNNGFLYYQNSVSNTSITDNQLAGLNFTGADVVIRKNRWVVDKSKITLQSGSLINYTSQSGYWPDKGNGYFIQNHFNCLDQEGEWYYSAEEKKLGIFTTRGSSALQNVQVSTIGVLVSINNQSNIVFDNITFTGANSQSFSINNSSKIEINNCDVLFSGANAVTAANTDYLTIQNTTINHTNNIAFNGVSCTNATIKNNKVSCTGVFAGMGDGDSGSYEAFMIAGDNNSIEQNTIDSTGYIPITFSGNNVTIKNNYISNYAFVKDDGGGIYTWNNGSNAPNNYGRKVLGNIVVNGMGAAEGTADKTKKYAHGIYIDDNASNVDISTNTVANCEGFGLYIHNARDLSIKNNTVYNNQVQLEMQHDDIAPKSLVTNNTVTDNILFSLFPNQPVAEYKTNNDDLINFGTYDNNYYCRPIDDNAVINTLKNVNGNYDFQQVDIAGWKAMYGKDANSKKTGKQVASYKINEITGSNKFGNGSFSDNIGGLYSYSSANNCVTKWSNKGIDGGTLQVSFTSVAGNKNKGTIIINVGSVTANKPYILRLSSLASDENKMLEVYLRKSLSPYTDLTDRKLAKIKASRSETEFLFIPSETETNASIGIDVPEQSDPVYLDNIQLLEANVTTAKVEDSVKFVYNAGIITNSFDLNSSFVDVKNVGYSGSITLNAFSSAILLNANSSVATPVSQCSATGNISYEEWPNVAGNNITDNIWSNSSATKRVLNAFEGPENSASNFASRIRGYICPPQTGNYTFWIAGDDAAELWLSTDDNAANKTKIAYNLSWTESRDWNKFPSQKSMQIYLQAGKKYYIEALHKQGDGGNNLAVSWQLPDGNIEAPIPGNRLSPFTASEVLMSNQILFFSTPADVTFGAAPFALSATSSSNLPVSFKVISGPATIAGNTVTITGAGVVTIEASQPGNAAYNAAPVVVKTFNVLSKTTAQCSATGNILREVWNNVGGNTIADNNWTGTPGSTNIITSFEGPENSEGNYASRIRGYICAPQTGNYTFWIAGDDATELWLSNTADPANKSKIAYSLSWTAPREWNKFSTQKSAQVYLEAGNKYYIEALHKQGVGGDNLSVAWQLPNGVIEAPIQGSNLSPFKDTQAPIIPVNQTITFTTINDVTFGTAPFALSATSSSNLPVSFRVISGPATIAGNTVTITGAGVVTIEASQPGNAAYNAAPVVVKTFNVLSKTTAQCSATGNILREVWNNVGGNTIADNNWTGTPGSTNIITSFEGPENSEGNYASRIRGYICAPQTGNYTFWIAGDDATELWLSNTADPANKSKIAYSLSWTAPREWNKFSTQKSAQVYLEAGNKYYIEALHKQGAGGDNLSVAWQLPNGVIEAPIQGSNLSPFKDTQAPIIPVNQTITFTTINDVTFGAAPFALSATSSSNLPVSFKVISGPATIAGNTVTITGAGVVTIEASQPGNAAYNAAPVVVKTFNVLSKTTAQCSATGNILREVWNNVGGNTIADNNWTGTPGSTNIITSFEGPENSAGNYASRIRGYICAPQTGNYTFWIAGDDATELWLSNTADPANKSKIAYSLSWTAPREWNKFSTQKSAQVYLEAGNKYYIEALHKQGAGGDNLSVAWQLPNGVIEAPIQGNSLSPYLSNLKTGVSDYVAKVTNLAMAPEIERKKLFVKPAIKIYPNPISTTATIELQTNNSGVASLQLFDVQNRWLSTIFEGKCVKNTKNVFTFDAGNLLNGVYFIRCHLNDEIVSAKIVIAR